MLCVPLVGTISHDWLTSRHWPLNDVSPARRQVPGQLIYFPGQLNYLGRYYLEDMPAISPHDATVKTMQQDAT